MAPSSRIHRLDRRFRWPGERRVAVVFNIAYEAWSDGRSPGIGPMGNPLPPGAFDTNARSWGEYGSVRGIERLLRVLERARIRASVMVSGLLAERVPDTVRAVAAAEHEIVAHGFSQDRIPAMLSPDDQRADIERTTAALERATGRPPLGWISPRGTPGVDMGRLLVAAGYQWHGDAFDDDRPYVEIHAGGPLVAVPLTMEINDLPHAMRFGRSPQQFVELFQSLLARMLDEEDEAVLIDVTAHAHVYGRPTGAWAYGDLARSVAARSDVWVATRGEIARHALNASRTRERA